MYDPTKPAKNKILSLISKTWTTPYISVKGNTYAIFKRKHSGFEVDHTDGIGTKGHYHWEQRTFKNAVLDALAMNLNDLALVRATPYKLQNHIVLPKDDDKALLEIVTALVNECKKRKIAVTGGETSIHNTTDGMDIGITVSGFVEKIMPNKFKKGDALIGLKSNGIHSNGITKIRELFGNETREEFTLPTKIYLDEVLRICKKYDVHGMMHITGGAYTKLKDLIKNEDVIIARNHTLKPQKIFFDIYSKGVKDVDMYKTFNCGVGFILSVSKNKSSEVAKEIGGSIIGEVVTGSGKVKVQSQFSNTEVIY